MDAIIEFIEGIAEGVAAAIDYLFSLISDLAYMVSLLGQFLLELPDYFGWLPSTIAAGLISIFGVVVIYKVIGREG